VRADVLSAVVLACLLTLTCSRKPRPAPPVVAFGPASSSSAPAPATIGPQGHDLPSLFVASLAEIDLRPAQEADIDAIVRDLRQLRKASEEAVRRLADDTMDGVGAGRLDHFEIDADIERLAQTVDARKPHVQSDIDRLHATLDAQQRRDLFQTMRKKAEAARVSAEREGGESQRKLFEELGLTPAQQEAIGNRLREDMSKRRVEMRAMMRAIGPQMKAIGDAFTSETFDARTAGVAEHSAEIARAMALTRVRFVEAILPELTPDQRIMFKAHLAARDKEIE